MFQIFRFFSNNKVILLFLFLEFVSLFFIFHSHSYHQSKFITSANKFSGYLITKSNHIKTYFNLREKNKDIVNENLILKNKLEKLKQELIPTTNVSIDTARKYSYISANVIKNSYRKRDNLLTLDKGSFDGIKPNMGVVLPNGIVGITLDVSKHFSTVVSLLNSNTSINVKLKKNNHFGSLQWNGKTYKTAHLLDIPTQSNLKLGDTIMSGGHSIIFPDQIPIGTVSKIVIKNRTFERVDVQLFEDYSALHSVYIVVNKFKDEQKELEEKSELQMKND